MLRTTLKISPRLFRPVRRLSVSAYRVPKEIRRQSPIFARQTNRNLRATHAFWDGAGSSGDIFALGALMAIFHAIQKYMRVMPNIHHVKRFTGSAKDWHIKQVLIAMAEQYPELKKRYSDVERLDKDVQEILKIFVTEGKEILRAYCKPVPGMVETSQMLEERRIKLILNTAFTREEGSVFREEMEKYGVVFSHMITSSDVVNSRPYASLLDKLKDWLGIRDRASIVVFGDSIYDVDAAAEDYFFCGLAEYSALVGIISLEEYAKMSPLELQTRREKAKEILAAAGSHYVLMDPLVPMWKKVKNVFDDVDLRLQEGERPYSLSQNNFQVLEEQPPTVSMTMARK